jgi:hypothetical protein
MASRIIDGIKSSRIEYKRYCREIRQIRRDLLRVASRGVPEDSCEHEELFCKAVWFDVKVPRSLREVVRRSTDELFAEYRASVGF